MSLFSNIGDFIGSAFNSTVNNLTDSIQNLDVQDLFNTALMSNPTTFVASTLINGYNTVNSTQSGPQNLESIKQQIKDLIDAHRFQSSDDVKKFTSQALYGTPTKLSIPVIQMYKYFESKYGLTDPNYNPIVSGTTPTTNDQNIVNNPTTPQGKVSIFQTVVDYVKENTLTVISMLLLVSAVVYFTIFKSKKRRY